MAEPRVLVVGAGLAGALLASRLQESGAEAVLIGTGGRPSGGYADATAVSGGLVRAFEPEPAARALATASLAELRSDPALLAEVDWERSGSLYLLDADPGTAAVPAGAELLTGTEIRRRFGVEGLPESTVGIWERQAGHLVPDRLRRAALSRLTRTEAVPMARVDQGTVELRDGRRLGGDLVVLAAGPWTPGLLRAAGLTTTLRTKHIQYAHYAVDRNDLPCFVDETSGLYGRPAGPGRMLFGMPGRRWDVDPATPEPDVELAEQVRAVAALRLPGLAARPLGEPVSAADCYSEPAGLALRAVGDGLHTFTGGSGGAAKIALAASRVAAAALLDHPSSVEVSTGQTEAER